MTSLATAPTLFSRLAARGSFRLWFGIIVVSAVVVVAVLAPLMAPTAPDFIDFLAIAKPPSAQHWFGTDEAGRDILSRLMYGARVSITVVVGSITVAMVSGVALGLVVGWFGGWLDSLIMRVVDIVIAFPTLVLALLVIALLGPGLMNATLAIAIVYIPYFVRIVRGEVLTLKTREFMLAAISTGTPTRRLLFSEMLPNLMGNVVVYASLAGSVALTTESALSFLGLGVQPPTPSWGYMIAAGMQYYHYWWISFFPGLAIFLTVLGFNFLGDALRDALDPNLGQDAGRRLQ